MVKKQWMNTIANIKADPYTNINTDHKVLEVEIRQKLKARTQPKGNQHSRESNQKRMGRREKKP